MNDKHEVINVEMKLRKGDRSYEAELSVEREDGNVVGGDKSFLVKLQENKLFEASGNLEKYSSLLTKMLFHSHEFQQQFFEAYGEAHGRGKYMRLRMSFNQYLLNKHVRWEALNLPGTTSPLCTRDDILFSRHMSSREYRALPYPNKNLNVLAAIANPPDYQKRGLSEINSESWISLVEEQFSESNIDFLTSNRANPCTIEQLDSTIPGHDIFIFISHGKMINGKGTLYLDGNKGLGSVVEVESLTKALVGVHRLPRLAILVICESAGSSASQSTHNALGPKLIEVGVPAVIAMQGELSMDTAKIFLPTLLESLLSKDNEGSRWIIDRAMTHARRAIIRRDDQWMPVLFMCLKNGYLWSEVNDSKIFESVKLIRKEIPEPSMYFCGRKDLLENIVMEINSNKVKVLGIYGAPGVGKTEFAYKVNQLVGNNYPDGQIYVDLEGNRDVSLTQNQVLRQLINSLNSNINVPEDLVAMKKLFRSLISGKRYLILLDNVREAQQIEFIERLPQGSLVIVTSRAHLSIIPFWKRLQVLDVEDSAQLILKIAPKVGELAYEFAKICGNMPLALTVLGSYISNHDLLDLNYILDEMKDGKQRSKLTNIDAAYRISYEPLDITIKKIWRKLAVFTRDFDVKAVMYVLGKTDDIMPVDPARSIQIETRKHLDYLVRQSLIEVKGDRIYLHDLARDFCDGLMKISEKKGAQFRHANYYLNILLFADRLYLQGGEGIDKGLKLYDLESREIEAGFHWSAQMNERDTEHLQLCSGYTKLGWNILELRLLPEERISWNEQSLIAAEILNDHLAICTHLWILGKAYEQIGDVKSLEIATVYFEKQLAVARKISSQQNVARARLGLGRIMKFNLDYVNALTYINEGLTLFKTIGDRRGECLALGDLGNAYFEYSHEKTNDNDYLSLSFRCFEDQLSISRELRDKREESTALANLAMVYEELEKYELAEKHYRDRLNIVRTLDASFIESVAENDLGRVYSQMGKIEQAIHHYENRVQITRRIGNKQAEITTSWTLGELYEKNNNFEKAISYMQIVVDYEKMVKPSELANHLQRIEKLKGDIHNQKYSKNQ